jgi:hypothetical protein
MKEFDIKLFRQNCLEDFERDYNKAKGIIQEYKDNPLFRRILNCDRQVLFGFCNCKINLIKTSQSEVLQNRDELSFIISLGHFISYYIQDDGEVTVRWRKRWMDENYEWQEEKNVPAFSEDSEPYLDSCNAGEGDKLVTEDAIIKALDYAEKRNFDRINTLDEEDFYTPQYIKYYE